MLRSDLNCSVEPPSTHPPSTTKPLQSDLDLASPSASCEGSFFKENININKSETPKLSMEPLQMKRKKKGGGYNLRKSLAWDRAFFTEEGVLDPIELSIISGASCMEEIPVINEDTLGRSQLPIKSSDRKELKSSLSKEVPSELCKDRRKHCLSPKFDSSSSNNMISTSLSSHNVSNPVGGNSQSRCGDCPRPLPSPSLKRIANASAGKAAAKEIKMPKVPGSKTGPSPVLMSASTIPKVTHVNRYQTAQPVFSTQRNAGLKSLSKSLKNTQNASKASSLRSAHLADRNSISQSSISIKRHSYVNNGSLLGGEADKDSGSNTTSNNITPSRLMHSSEGQDEIITSVAPLAQNAHDSGRTMHPSQNQTMNRSGLRMPSPSLSFFSQPKASSLCDSAVRDTHIEICGSQNPGGLRLQDTSRRTFKKDRNIQESTCSGSFRSGNVVPSHVNGVSHKVIKPDLERNLTQMVGMKFFKDPMNSDPTSYTLVGGDGYIDEQTRDTSEKIGIGRISSNDAKIQKIDNELSSQSGDCEQMIHDKSLEKATLRCRLEREICGREWRNQEPVSKHNYAIHGSETKSSTDEPCKGLSTCKFAVLDQSAITKTRYENIIDHRQDSTSAMHELCKPDFHEPCWEKIDQLNHSPSETGKITDRDKYVLKTKENVGELLGGSQVYGSCCNGTANFEAPERSVTSALTEHSYTVSKHQYGYFLEEAALTEVVAGNLLVEEEYTRDALRSSTIGGCQKPNLISDAGDGSKQSGSVFEVPKVCHVVELQTGLVMSRESYSVNNSISSESHKNLSNIMSNPDGRDAAKAKSDASPNETVMSVVAFSGRWQDESNLRSHELKTTLLYSPANRRSSNSLYKETEETEIDHCSSLPKRRMPKVSHKNLLGNVTDEVPITEDCSGIKCTTSIISLKEGGTNMDNLSSIADLRTPLVQSESMNECRAGESECLELPNAGTVAEDRNHTSGRLQFENLLQRRSTVSNEPSEDTLLGSMVDSLTGQNARVGTLRNFGDSAQESSLEHESCSSIDESDDQPYFEEAIADASRVKPFPYPTKSEVCKDTSSSLNELYPKLGQVQVEAALAPRDINSDSLNEKSLTLVLPQNAVPFSDEWLAAIEAAGEGILTRKGGTVQNSPPNKTLPEPSPWSPVKKKNNQIGPFDCTKFSNNLPTDSN